MKRFYYVSDDLDDLEALERELEADGIPTPHIHVLSNDDAGVQQHHLNEVHALWKTDIVHSTLKGAALGFVAAMLVLLVAYMSGLPAQVTWVPFVFLAIVAQGFCAWEGGLYGIQEPNSRFRQFADALASGKHVLMVDLKPEQQPVFDKHISGHRSLRAAGDGEGAPDWVVSGQAGFEKFKRWAP